MDHAITTSKLLRRYERGPSNLGLGSRRNGDRVVAGVFGPGTNSRFAGYVQRGDRLEDHRIIEGVRAAVRFLEREDEDVDES